MLSQLPCIKTAIVSGRSLKDVRRLVNLKHLVYVGNHGLEIKGPKIMHVHPEAQRIKPLLRSIERSLKPFFKGLSGVWIENKTYTLTIHYRKASESDALAAKNRLIGFLIPYATGSQLTLHEGKKIWEIRPNIRWNKGHAVNWLLARQLAHINGKLMSIYCGDDRTDEDAFSALQKSGITIKVTDNPKERSAAKYFVRNPCELYNFLMTLRRIKLMEVKPGKRS